MLDPVCRMTVGPDPPTVESYPASKEATAFIVVRGGYSRDTIRVEAGKPVKFIFNRQEADPCSEKVVFDAFGVSADLPEGENVPVEFTPTEPGEYEFACQMGMLRGKVVVS